MATWPLPFVIAHRGASQLAPENTLSALTLAKTHSATWVECDVQLTQDGHPIIFHDTKLNRTTNLRGNVSDITLAKLKLADAGSWFSDAFQHERVPTLQEWLRTAADLKLGLNLEIKSNTKKESILLADCIVDHLQKYWPAHSNKIFMSSANQFALMQVHERAKSIPLGWIHDKPISEKNAAQLIQSNIVSIHQPFAILNADYVAMLHEVGLCVLAFTVNDMLIASELKKIGVDGIFTDNIALYSL